MKLSDLKKGDEVVVFWSREYAPQIAKIKNINSKSITVEKIKFSAWSGCISGCSWPYIDLVTPELLETIRLVNLARDTLGYADDSWQWAARAGQKLNEIMQGKNEN